jgi:hypothetical protein
VGVVFKLVGSEVRLTCGGERAPEERVGDHLGENESMNGIVVFKLVGSEVRLTCGGERAPEERVGDHLGENESLTAALEFGHHHRVHEAVPMEESPRALQVNSRNGMHYGCPLDDKSDFL